MNVSIELPDNIETALRRTAAAAGKDVASFVKQIITERLAEPDLEDAVPLVSPEIFAARQSAWVKLHPVLDHAIDDSRESFYVGRGE